MKLTCWFLKVSTADSSKYAQPPPPPRNEATNSSSQLNSTAQLSQQQAQQPINLIPNINNFPFFFHSMMHLPFSIYTVYIYIERSTHYWHLYIKTTRIRTCRFWTARKQLRRRLLLPQRRAVNKHRPHRHSTRNPTNRRLPFTRTHSPIRAAASTTIRPRTTRPPTRRQPSHPVEDISKQNKTKQPITILFTLFCC